MYMSRPHLSALVLALAEACLALSCTRTPDYSPSRLDHTTRFPETRTISERKVWLSWTKEKRQGFIVGYLVGHERGYRRGCYGVESEVKCLSREQLDSPSSTDYIPEYGKQYADTITTFYEKYPSEDDVPIWYVLEYAAGPKKMNAESVSETLHGRP